MVTHHVAQNLHVGGIETHTRTYRMHQLDSHHRVVSRVSLAEVVEPRSNQQKVRTRHSSDELRCVGGSLAKMAVNGEAVIRVALWFRPDARPLGEKPGHEVVSIERFENMRARRTGPEQRDERVTGTFRPRRGERWGIGSQSNQACSGDGSSLLGGQRPESQYQRGVAGRVRALQQHQLTVLNADIGG